MRKVLGVVLLFFGSAAPAFAADEQLPYYDVRATAHRVVHPSAAANQRVLAAPGRALSGPSGASRPSIARGFLRAHAADLGLDTADVDAMSAPQRRATPHGVSIVDFTQSYQGVPAFDRAERVVVDRAGRVVEVINSAQHDLSVPTVKPTLSSARALRLLRDNVRGTAGGGTAALTLFTVGGKARLAWNLRYRKSSTEDYHAVIDATTGRLLLRANSVKNANDASIYRLYPGAPNGGTPESFTFPASWLGAAAPDLDGRFAHTWSDVDDDNVADASEEIPRTAGGDFVYPFTDFSAAVVARAGPLACHPTLCAWDSAVPNSWDTNREQNGVQAFYLVNRFHDHLADPNTIDFGPPENFDTQDPVQVNADDGANIDAGLPDGDHLDNANMDTHADPEPPVMQMYLFNYSEDFPEFEYNGGDDALTVWHEYTHGLSNRLITDATGEGAVNSPHAGAMGEAWSDWYALDFADSEGLLVDDPDVNGQMDLGVSSDSDDAAGDFGRHLTRTQGLDCPVGSGSSDPATRCPGGFDTGPGGYTLGDFGKIVAGPEVHADGEIWGETLWDLREADIDAYGYADGVAVTDFLVTEAMRLSPPEPSMLDERDAILAADDAAGTGLSDVIWRVFAHRGMGFFATATSGSDTHPAEDFNTPPPDDGPTGTVSGRVTDAGTGLPRAGVQVTLGRLGTTTGADGRYSLTGVPAGTYGKLAFTPPAGYDAVATTRFTVPADGTVTHNVAVKRDWAAAAGGATISDVSQDGDINSRFGCGTDGLIDQDAGVSWLAPNPHPSDPADTPAEPPFAVVALPQSIDVTAIGIDPSSSCGDGASAMLKDYRLEVSSDGTTFRPFKGDGNGSFTTADAGRLTLLSPDAGNGRGVRYVKLTPKTPQRQSTPADPCPTCSGNTDISITELEVFGNRANVSPSGTLRAQPASVKVGKTVTFTASFADPDSAITGYAWDFDGNGSTDATTTAPTATHAYPAAGSFTARVTARDFIAPGSGTAVTRVDVANPRGPTGSLRADPATATPAQPVKLTASFAPGDAPIAGYAWDFDGDGLSDRTTTSPSTTVVYGAAGSYAPRVTVTDTAGIANSATTAVSVKTRSRAPRITAAKRGSHAKLRLTATCATRCVVKGTLVVSSKLKRRLDLKSRTIARVRKTVTKTKPAKISIMVSRRVVKALERHHRKSIAATVSASARYADGRVDTAKRKVTIRIG